LAGLPEAAEETRTLDLLHGKLSGGPAARDTSAAPGTPFGVPDVIRELLLTETALEKLGTDGRVVAVAKRAPLVRS
jgi:hypothetical protein